MNANAGGNANANVNIRLMLHLLKYTAHAAFLVYFIELHCILVHVGASW